MRYHATRFALTFAAALVAASVVHARVISGNFCSVAAVHNPGFAGTPDYSIYRVGFNTAGGEWFNDLTDTNPQNYGAVDSANGAGAAAQPGLNPNNLYYNTGDGVPTDVLISWEAEAQDTHDARIDLGVESRHDQMMAGYLNSLGVNSLIKLSGSEMDMAFGGNPYDVYLYIDGEDAATTPEIGSWTAALTGGTTYYGQDTSDFLATDPADPNSTSSFALVDDTVSHEPGNYVVFRGLTDSSFEITLTAIDSGVVLNGFEIVEVPEPSGLALFGLIASVGLIRRRRRA